MIDLHSHSSASDGSLAPAELVALAADGRIEMLALTDHDTVEGVAEFLDAVDATPSMKGLGGIEISSVGNGSGAGAHVHVLGYGVGRESSEEFHRTLEDFQAARDDRGSGVVRKLQELGFDVAIEEVLEEAGGGPVFGRPHIAAVMLKKGYVEGIQQAFDEYLAVGAKAYVERDRPTSTESVEAIRGEGLVPVLAHPPQYELPEDRLDGFVHELCEAGLLGIECFYSSYDESDIALCQKLAARYGLIQTGGSDFHGDSKPHIKLGTGTGSLHVPPAVGEKLLAKVEETRKGE